MIDKQASLYINATVFETETGAEVRGAMATQPDIIKILPFGNIIVMIAIAVFLSVILDRVHLLLFGSVLILLFLVFKGITIIARQYYFLQILTYTLNDEEP